MILGIDFNKVYRDEIKGYARKFEYVLKDEEIKISIGDLDDSVLEDPKQSIVVAQEADVEKVKKLIRENFPPSFIRLTKEEGTSLQYGLAKVQKTKLEEQSVTKSIEVIRNRIDEFGVTEPEILSQGKDRLCSASWG